MQKKQGLDDGDRSDKACEVTKDQSVDYGKKGRERDRERERQRERQRERE